MHSNKKQNVRSFMVQVIFIALFLILFNRLWQIQIIDEQKYAKDFEYNNTKTIRCPNARGNIYDCNGKVLAYNKLVYNVTMVDSEIYKSEREHQLTLNSIIYRITKKLTKGKEQINNELKIEARKDGSYVYTLTGKSLLRFKADIFGEAYPEDMTQEQKDMSADDMIQFLSGNSKFALYGQGEHDYSLEELKRYGLPKKYTQKEILTIVGIRYMLYMNAYKRYVPIVLARDISKKMAAYILENNRTLSGIDIERDFERVYNGGEAFSHILGYTGKISEEEMDEYAISDKNYTTDSIIGKSGIERYFESELQGIDGEKKITVDEVGRIVSKEKQIKESVRGKDVYLSIDKDLQNKVYNILEKNLARVISDNLINTKKFDKLHISDASDIRIPIYDVYMALVNNSIIELDRLYSDDSTELEKHIAKLIKEKCRKTAKYLKKKISKEKIEYKNLSEEMQEYVSYIVNEMEIFDNNSIDKDDDMYRNWKEKSGVSIKDFLDYAILNDWIASGIIDTKRGYFTTDELHILLMKKIKKKMTEDGEFKKILFKWLLFDGYIKENDICQLLYDQNILSDEDNDYKKLLSGEIDAFLFMKKKIEKLDITPAMLALDPCSASAVVIHQKTGKVLALVSYPGYDNNRLANKMDVVYYSKLLNDKSLPLYNRATQQLTAPGSTFKPLTIITGLQEGVIYSDSSVICDGVFDKVTPNLKCWKHTGHGKVENAPAAIQYSCNDYLCEIAYRLGTKNSMEYADNAALNKLQKYSKLFGMDKKSGVEIAESNPHITDAYGIPSSIGQGTHNYATIQLARYINAIASKGSVFNLSLINGIKDINGKFKKISQH